MDLEESALAKFASNGTAAPTGATVGRGLREREGKSIVVLVDSPVLTRTAPVRATGAIRSTYT